MVNNKLANVTPRLQHINKGDTLGATFGAN